MCHPGARIGGGRQLVAVLVRLHRFRVARRHRRHRGGVEAARRAGGTRARLRERPSAPRSVRNRRGRGHRLPASTRQPSRTAHAGRSRDRLRPQMGQPQRRRARGETREHDRHRAPRRTPRSEARRSAPQAPLTARLRLNAARAPDSGTRRRRVLETQTLRGLILIVVGVPGRRRRRECKKKKLYALGSAEKSELPASLSTDT